MVLLQKWEDRIKHAHAQDSEADQDKPALDALREVSPEEAAFMALKKWASTGRKCRQALKRANPTAVEEMELHYLQFMRQVGMMACVHTAHAHQLPLTARHARCPHYVFTSHMPCTRLVAGQVSICQLALLCQFLQF